jgi:hypothetical protein
LVCKVVYFWNKFIRSFSRNLILWFTYKILSARPIHSLLIYCSIVIGLRSLAWLLALTEISFRSAIVVYLNITVEITWGVDRMRPIREKSKASFKNTGALQTYFT